MPVPIAYMYQLAFYLFPSIKRFGLSSRELCLKLLHDYNVLVVPGDVFGKSGEGFVRISYATSMDKLKMLIRLLKCFIDEHCC